MRMNEEIRETVKNRLREMGLSNSALGRQLEIEQPNIVRALNGRSGNIPETWQKILDATGLKLIAVPKDE